VICERCGRVRRRPFATHSAAALLLVPTPVQGAMLRHCALRAAQRRLPLPLTALAPPPQSGRPPLPTPRIAPVQVLVLVFQRHLGSGDHIW
jgi:hypothetical protein